MFGKTHTYSIGTWYFGQQYFESFVEQKHAIQILLLCFFLCETYSLIVLFIPNFGNLMKVRVPVYQLPKQLKLHFFFGLLKCCTYRILTLIAQQIENHLKSTKRNISIFFKSKKIWKYNQIVTKYTHSI